MIHVLDLEGDNLAIVNVLSAPNGAYVHVIYVQEIVGALRHT